MNLKDILKKKNMTMYRLAKTTGLGQSTINEIANKKRRAISINTAVKISKALDISVEELNNYIS